MLKSYFRTAWRNLVQNKGYSALNILGLATGMAVALLIGLWVYYQCSYDRFLPGYGQVYQVQYRSVRNGDITTQSSVSLLLEGVMKSDIPEIKYIAQADWMGPHGLVVGDKRIYLGGGMVGEDFLHVFQYPLLRGEAGGVLKEMYSIVLTESTAKSLFGGEDPMGRMVKIDNAHDLKVTGILKDLPGNSSLQFNYLVPFSYLVQTSAWVKQASTTWDNNSFQTFVALRPGVSYARVEPGLKRLMPQHKPDWVKIVKAEVFMHPLKDWHLYSDFKNGIAVGGHDRLCKDVRAHWSHRATHCLYQLCQSFHRAVGEAGKGGGDPEDGWIASQGPGRTVPDRIPGDHALFFFIVLIICPAGSSLF